MKPKAIRTKVLSLLTGKIAIIALLTALQSCNFAQSVNKDLKTGLVTRGNGLSCERVYLSSNEEVIKRNELVYGEVLTVNFDGLDGFNRIDDNAFPGMLLMVINEQGDTVMFHEDLYSSYAEGIEFYPLQLNARVTVAAPMHSSEDYSLLVNIWDKKGEGRFKANLDFSVVRDDKIAITSNQLSYDEIYLFSRQKGLTITNGQVGFDETVFLLFEGLEGFMVESGNVHIGLGLTIKDSDGNLVLEEADLTGNAPMSFSEIHTQLAPNFSLTGTEISNPVTCEINIWDKKSEASLTATTQLDVN